MRLGESAMGRRSAGGAGVDSCRSSGTRSRAGSPSSAAKTSPISAAQRRQDVAAASQSQAGGSRRAMVDAAISPFVDQWMVNDADAATSYGVVVFLFNWTM
jgi:hypothetical protein